MARIGILTHRKFLRLCHLLAPDPPSHVLGHLEWLWHQAYLRGDDHLGDATDLSLAAAWEGYPNQFADAMEAAGFVDKDAAGHYRLHNLWKHAPAIAKANQAWRETFDEPRICEHCGAAYHSTTSHSKFCSMRCRVSHHRVEKCNAGVTEGSVTVTHMKRSVTLRNAQSGSGSLNERTNEEENSVTHETEEEGEMGSLEGLAAIWTAKRAEILKMANDYRGRVWNAHHRLCNQDKRLMLAACLLATAAPVKPYGLAWLQKGVDTTSDARVSPKGLERPGGYLAKVLGEPVLAAGRNWRADREAAEAVVKEGSSGGKDSAEQEAAVRPVEGGRR